MSQPQSNVAIPLKIAYLIKVDIAHDYEREMMSSWPEVSPFKFAHLVQWSWGAQIQFSKSCRLGHPEGCLQQR